MKKIVYIVSTLQKSGPTNQLFNIINNLDRSVFEPSLITLSPEPEDSRWVDYESTGINLMSLNLSRLQGFFLAKKKLSTLLKEIQPHLIHTQGIRADSMSAKLRINLPKVATIHNFPQYDYKMAYGRLLGRLMLFTHVRILKKLNKLIACSNSVAANLTEKLRFPHVIAVPNGVDQFLFAFKKDNKNFIKKKLNLTGDSKIWVSTGHLSSRKDPLFLINAWLNLDIKYKNHYLIFLGGGELEQQCLKLTEKSSNIYALGNISNVVDYLQDADFFLSSSKAEGLPMAVLEGLSCGLAVLLSDIEPHKEIHAMSPNIGCLYALGDETSFIDAFQALVESNYQERSKAAIDLIEKELSAEVMSRKYQSIYKTLLV